MSDSDVILKENEYDNDYVRRVMRDSRPWWMTILPAVLLALAGATIYFAVGGSASLPGIGSSEEQATIGSDTTVTGEAIDEDPEATADEEAGTGDDGAKSTDSESTDGESTDGESTDVATAADGAAEPAGPVALAPPTDGPYVDATLADNIFVLSGVVPDEEMKQALEQQAELAYAPFFTSTLEVDDTIGSAEWLAGAPQAVGLIPMITDGTIRIQEGAVTLVGRSPSERWKIQFEQAIAVVTGLPVASEDISITGLKPPSVLMKVDNGAVTLDGVLPSNEIEQIFLQSAGAVYGADEVTSTMQVDDEIYTSFWMYTLPGIFQLLAPFENYEVRVVDGVVTGSAQGGVVFEANSFVVPPDAAGAMSVAVAMMARDRALNMTMIGHTDNRGPDDVNLRLSAERAQAVVQFFIDQGIDQSRLKAEGRGSAEPVASNDTVEGRARNRRVEFSFGYDPVAG